jgi:hypothetical protein
MIMLRVAASVRSHFVVRLPEWLLSGELGLLGLQFLRSNETFATSKTYSVISHYISEAAWGSVALGISFFWLVSLILNGTFAWFARCSKWVRSLSAFLGAGFWSVSAFGVFEANPHSPAIVNNGGYAAMAFIVSLITAREVGRADRKARDAAAGKQ